MIQYIIEAEMGGSFDPDEDEYLITLSGLLDLHEKMSDDFDLEEPYDIKELRREVNKVMDKFEITVVRDTMEKLEAIKKKIDKRDPI